MAGTPLTRVRSIFYRLSACATEAHILRSGDAGHARAAQLRDIDQSDNAETSDDVHALAVESRGSAAGAGPGSADCHQRIDLFAGGHQMSVRPVRPDDLELIQSYVRGLSPASRYFRFLGAISELSATELHRATHPSASSASMVLESRLRRNAHHDRRGALASCCQRADL